MGHLSGKREITLVELEHAVQLLAPSAAGEDLQDLIYAFDASLVQNSMPLFGVLQDRPLRLEAAHPALQEYFVAKAILNKRAALNPVTPGRAERRHRSAASGALSAMELETADASSLAEAPQQLRGAPHLQLHTRECRAWTASRASGTRSRCGLIYRCLAIRAYRCANIKLRVSDLGRVEEPWDTYVSLHERKAGP